MKRILIDLPKTETHIRNLESFLAENKLEAIFIGMRAYFRMLKSRDEGFYNSEFENSPEVFRDLWFSEKHENLFGKISLIDETSC